MLITGATGFIGGWLTERLITTAPTPHIRALVRNREKGQWLADLGVELIPGDITDPVSISKAIAGCQIVFNAAAWVGEKGDRDEVWQVNVTGTENMVQAARKIGIERFIHLSSCAVYGSLQQHNIDETTPTRMKDHIYSDSKVAAEEVLFRAYRDHQFPIVIARASQVYGPRSYQFTIRPVELIKAGQMILIDGGRHLCKPIYIDNLIEGLILCATTEAAIGQAINFTDGITVPWCDFFGAYGKMLQIDSFPSVPFPLAWLVALFNEMKATLTGKKSSFNREVVKALRSNNSFSNQKALTLLGWQPKIDFAEGMKRTEDWLRTEGYLEQRMEEEEI